MRTPRLRLSHVLNLQFLNLQYRAHVLKRLFVLLAIAFATPAFADDAPVAHKPINVPELFATTCGWCHSDAGRAEGKGPQLMNTARSDDFIRNRIKNGKEGKMPAFATSFTDSDIDQIIAYIHALKPE